MESFQQVTAKKVLGKKVLIFGTKKVLWQKSPFIKKCPEIKSYYSRKCMGAKDAKKV